MLNRDDDSFMNIWVINLSNIMWPVVILLQHHCMFQSASKNNIAFSSQNSKIIITENTFISLPRFFDMSIKISMVYTTEIVLYPKHVYKHV